MTDQVQSNRRATGTRSVARTAVLAVALIVPLAVLFAGAWGTASGAVDALRTEQQGVLYLRSLAPLTTAITQTESIAVGGSAVNFDSLDKAALAVDGVDKQYGDELQTTALWDNLDAKIQQLHGRTMVQALAVYDSFSEVSTLLLQLYDKVRMSSGLVRDRDADTYFLTDGAARQLPAAVVAAGQYGDLIIGSNSLPASAVPSLVPLSLTARASLNSAAQELVGDITQAVDQGGSGSLNPTILDRLDRFRLSIDALAPVTALIPVYQSDNGSAEAAKDKAAVENASSALSETMLDSVDALLTTRLGDNRATEWQAIAAALVALAVALTPLTRAIREGRRANRDFGRTTPPPTPPAAPAETGPLTPRIGSTLPTRVPERRPPVGAGAGLTPARSSIPTHRAAPDAPSAGHDYWER